MVEGDEAANERAVQAIQREEEGHEQGMVKFVQKLVGGAFLGFFFKCVCCCKGFGVGSSRSRSPVLLTLCTCAIINSTITTGRLTRTLLRMVSDIDNELRGTCLPCLPD